MLKESNERKINYKKDLKIYQSQIRLIFKTHDPGYTIESKH